jgi:glycosyltransferase involved in cell wall biosynthesis
VRAILRAVKEVLKAVAPPETRRRAVLKAVRRMVRGAPPSVRPKAPFIPPKRAEDPYNLRALNHILRATGRQPLEGTQKRPEAGETATARWVLTTLMRRKDLRLRHPRALRDGAGGRFCLELCAALGERSAEAKAVRAVFEQGLEQRPRQRYDVYHDMRQAFPLALTPAGRALFLVHLLETAQQLVPLTDEAILWFHLYNAEDPYQGLVNTYLLTPTWQERFPDGLTRFGWDRLREWVRREYRITGAWIGALPAPRAHDAVEEGLLDRIAGSVGQFTPPSSEADLLGANIIAHFRYPSGLMEASLNTVRALETAGVRRSCRDLPAGVNHGCAGDRSDCLGLEPYDITLLHMAPEPLVEMCYPLAGLWRRPGIYRIAVWYWELETAPPEWARHAALLNEVWAPTTFIHRALSRIMPVPVVPMLPGMLPPVAPDNMPRAHFGLDPSKFLFLFLFDMNSVMERKNPLATVAAFRQAFDGSRDVQLAIKVSRGDADPESFARLQQACDEAGCVLIDRVLSREESYGLLNACNAYVSLHRSEGFGLTMAEAMFFGKPVIATGYSGNLDFMSADNSILIPYEMTPLTRDYAVYRQGSLWADPSVPAAAEAMRRLVEQSVAARALGERARFDVAETLSLEAYGRRMRKRLGELTRGAAARRAVA